MQFLKPTSWLPEAIQPLPFCPESASSPAWLHLWDIQKGLSTAQNSLGPTIRGSHPFLQEADGRILQALLEKEDELQRVQLARREQALADAAWMKQVIEEQLQLEKAREAELQLLLR